jgi:tetratricopeptide (TPR) repeat protein
LPKRRKKRRGKARSPGTGHVSGAAPVPQKAPSGSVRDSDSRHDDLPRRRRKLAPIWPFVVALVAGAVYFNTLSNEFALDDLPLVRDNPTVRSLSEIGRQFLRPYWPMEGEAAGLYRPVTSVSFNLNHAMTGPGPTGYHAGNLFLHMLVSLLCWYVARLAGKYYGTALLTALLFAVHPLHTEVVANIVGRAELLAALWILAAWLAHRRGTKSRGGGAGLFWSSVAAGCYLLGLLSKEHVVLAPVLFALDDRLRDREQDNAPPTPWTAYASYLPAVAVGLVSRVFVLGGIHGPHNIAYTDNPAAFGGILARLATAAWVQVKYLVVFLWPVRLSSDYSFDAIPLVESVSDPRLWAGLLWAAALVFLFVVGWRRSRPVALGVAVWVLFLLPTANLFFASGSLMAERLTYLPSFGGCLILGHLGAWAATRGRSEDGRARRAVVTSVILVALVVLGLLSARTVRRNPVWRNNTTLALHDVNVMPRSAKLHAGAAIVLHARGELAAAEAAYRRAVDIYPGYAQMFYNLGELLARQGAREEAIRYLRRATELSPDNPRPYKRLGPLLELEGRRDDALEAYAAGARLDPGDLELRFNYGRLLFAAGRPEPALRVLEALARDDPQGITGALARALSAQLHGDLDSAAVEYQNVLRDPRTPPAVRARVERHLTDLRAERERRAQP